MTLAGDDLVARARADFGRLARLEAKKATVAPAELDAVTATRGGVRFDVYGVIHGLVGGDDATYKAFVDARVAKLELVLFENGLGWFYKSARAVTIPDFHVLGTLGSFSLGLGVGFELPRLLIELVREVVKPARVHDGEDPIDYDPRYHAIPPEVRRGVDLEAVLPARLEVEAALAARATRGWRGAFGDPLALVPRSLFMAGFAEGYARARGLAAVSLVVGDLHATEIGLALETEAPPGPWFEAGRRFGARGDGPLWASFLLAKVHHLGCAAIGGVLVLLPVIVLAGWLLGRR